MHRNKTMFTSCIDNEKNVHTNDGKNNSDTITRTTTTHLKSLNI